MKIDDVELPDIVWWGALIVTALLWLERRIAPTLRRVGVTILRYGLAVMFLSAGATRVFVPSGGLGVADELIALGLPLELSVGIGMWEILIGACFLEPRWVRYGALQVILYAPATILPLLVLVGLSVGGYPLLTLGTAVAIVGIVGAALVVWDAVTDPVDDRQ